MNRESKSSRGFTLIELLAVIAVILLLLSLLTPALQKARDRAYLVTCMSNCRQGTMAIVHYAGDNDGTLPSANWGGGQGAANWGWLSLTNFWADTTSIHNGQIWPYMGNEKVYRCPASVQPAFGVATADCPFEPDDTRMVTSYNMNGSVCDYGNTVNGSTLIGPYDTVKHLWLTYRLSEMKPADIIYWEGDETSQTKGWWWDGGNFPWEGISARHFGSGTIASLDGRVEKMLTADFYTLANASVPNRLRNDPRRRIDGVFN